MGVACLGLDSDTHNAVLWNPFIFGVLWVEMSPTLQLPYLAPHNLIKVYSIVSFFFFQGELGDTWNVLKQN